MTITQLLEYLYRLRQEFADAFDPEADDARNESVAVSAVASSRARLELTEQLTMVEALRVERAKYPPSGLTAEQKAAILNDACFRVGGPWGLLAKPDGNNCPCGDERIACDIVFNRDSRLHFDVFIDQEGSATISWQDKGTHSGRWVAPRQPSVVDPADPPPVDPPPTGIDLAAVIALLVAFDRKLDEMRAILALLRDTKIVDVQVAVDAIRHAKDDIIAVAKQPRPLTVSVPILGTARGTIGAPTA